MRLRELDGGDAQLQLQCPAQLASADPEFAGETVHAASVERAGSDASRRQFCETRDRVDTGEARREFRPAAQAGTKAGAFGRCRIREEPPILAQRDACGTDGAAVNPGGRNADEEYAIEARIACFERLDITFSIEVHGSMIGRRSPLTGRFRPSH